MLAAMIFIPERAISWTYSVNFEEKQEKPSPLSENMIDYFQTEKHLKQYDTTVLSSGYMTKRNVLGDLTTVIQTKENAI